MSGAAEPPAPLPVPANLPVKTHFEHYYYFYLSMIILGGALVRFCGLEHHPPGLFRDEAEKGYNAWAIATRGGAVELSGGAPGVPPIAFHRWPWMINVNGTRTSAIYQYF